MNGKYDNIQWVVQQNLTHPADFEALKNACETLGVGFIGVNIIPFTPHLPDFGKSRHSITYGSTTYNNLALKDEHLRRGLFFDETAFTMENYLEKWGQHMLNHGASITTFQELTHTSRYAPDELLFIRPNDDSKSFAGEIKRFDEIGQWYESLKNVESSNLSPNSKIVVSEPYNIRREWRLWIVNKRVVTASLYRENFRLKKEAGCPAEVVSFAEERCREYTPHDAFVMDICECGDAYYIVECGCINGAGFYKANIMAVVAGVTDYFKTTL